MVFYEIHPKFLFFSIEENADLILVSDWDLFPLSFDSGFN